MPPPLIYDPSQVDCTKVVADKEVIRKYNLQRFEMELLDAIVYYDMPSKIIVGYKDVTDQEFWVRGHVPGKPLMPGVMMCEAAAQLTSYYILKEKVFDSNFCGLSGFDNVRFRGPVVPGDRLVLVGRLVRERKSIAVGEVQGFVNNKLVFECTVSGIALQIDVGG